MTIQKTIYNMKKYIKESKYLENVIPRFEKRFVEEYVNTTYTISFEFIKYPNELEYYSDVIKHNMLLVYKNSIILNSIYLNICFSDYFTLAEGEWKYLFKIMFRKYFGFNKMNLEIR